MFYRSPIFVSKLFPVGNSVSNAVGFLCVSSSVSMAKYRF